MTAADIFVASAHTLFNDIFTHLSCADELIKVAVNRRFADLFALSGELLISSNNGSISATNFK